jgi:hypothetical protein
MNTIGSNCNAPVRRVNAAGEQNGNDKTYYKNQWQIYFHNYSPLYVYYYSTILISYTKKAPTGLNLSGLK